jgi:hypothetical protein
METTFAYGLTEKKRLRLFLADLYAYIKVIIRVIVLKFKIQKISRIENYELFC